MEFQRLDSDDLDVILGTLREFAEREMPLEKRLEWDRDNHCPEPLVRAMTSPDVGLHLVFLPEDCDGLGGGAFDVYRLCEEFARIDLGVATAMLAIALGVDPLRVGSTAEQRQRWMGRVAREGLLVAYAVTEPEAGSNVESLKTVAKPVTDDSGAVTHYILDGVKQFISNGSFADLYLILARAPEGPSFFVVEKGTDGLRPGKHEEKHGIRSSDTAQVILEGVRIPRENLVGGVEGQGLKQANEVFGFTRLMVASLGLGAGLAALERAVAYARERQQFGAPLHEKRGYTQKLLVPNAVRLAASRAYIEHVADRLDSGEQDLQVEGSIAKYYVTEAANRAADDAVQALGGYGYCTEYEVEKIRRDARILTIYEGTSEIQQNIIGLFRLRQCVRARGAYYAELAGELEGATEVGGPILAQTARFLDRFALACFRSKLSRHQDALFTLANCMAEVEVGAALCRVAATREPGAPGADLLAAQARIFASDAALAVRTRLLQTAAESSCFGAEEIAKLTEEAHLPGAVAACAGRQADRDLVARALVEA